MHGFPHRRQIRRKVIPPNVCFLSCTISIKHVNKINTHTHRLQSSPGISLQSLNRETKLRRNPCFLNNQSKRGAPTTQRRRAALGGRGFEAKDLAGARASLAPASFNLLCEHVVCNGGRHPVSSDLLLRSSVQFGGSLLSALHLRKPPRKMFWPSCVENILLRRGLFCLFKAVVS